MVDAIEGNHGICGMCGARFPTEIEHRCPVLHYVQPKIHDVVATSFAVYKPPSYIYLIEKSWYDGLTSMREPDCGYEPVAYVKTKAEAERIVKEGGIDNRPYYPMPTYKYKRLEEW